MRTFAFMTKGQGVSGEHLVIGASFREFHWSSKLFRKLLDRFRASQIFMFREVVG